jgi:integrase
MIAPVGRARSRLHRRMDPPLNGYAEINGGWRIGSPTTMAAELQRFSAAIRLRTGPDTAKRSMARIHAFLAVCRPDATMTDNVTAYLANGIANGWSPKTAQNHCGSLASFFEYVGLSPNPCHAVKLPKPEKRLARYLTPAEIDQAVTLARKHGIANEVKLALTTGLRLSEMIRLKWADIDDHTKMLIVRKSKSHRQRAVPLCPSAIDTLHAQRPITAQYHYVFPARQTFRGGWRFKDGPRAISWWIRAAKPLQEAVGAFLIDAGERSTGRAWHMLRHTFASVAAQRGVSLYKIAQWLGHTDTRTTEIYAHLAAGYDTDIEIADPLRTPNQRSTRALDDDDIAAAAVGAQDLLAIIKRHGLLDEVAASTMLAVEKIMRKS